mgnify:CR=1 FL=1
MTQRSLYALKHYETIEGKKGIMVESWNVPDDFTDDEVGFFQELCYNGVLKPYEAVQTVRSLREETVPNAPSLEGQYNVDSTFAIDLKNNNPLGGK